MSKDAFSGIRDNYLRGTVGDFLKEKIQAGVNLSFVSAHWIRKKVIKSFLNC